MRANELSALLWQERELLDLLIFKLTEEQLLLTAGRTRWLQHATTEVERVVERLRTAGVARAIEVDCLAEEWNVTADQPTLNDIAVAAPAGPWGDIFRAHLEAMTAQTAQIKELRDLNESFLRSAARSAQETAAGLLPQTGTYDAQGSTQYANMASGGHLFDTRL